VLYLLAQAGFGNVAVYGGSTREPAGPEHTMVVFQARRHG
jgi:hypothetical protein